MAQSKKKIKDFFTGREIAEAINNALVQARLYDKEGISEKRAGKLRAYTEALFGPLFSEIDEEYLGAEEAVFICLAGAALFQNSRVLRTDKLPSSAIVQPILRDKS